MIAGMALSYLPVDREQQFLLAPDVREWLPEGHLAWFVLDVVGAVDTSVLHARHRLEGPGRRAYDPEMLLALLVYAYCTGQRSSRRIEQLCEVDVAYRVIAANWVPDHTTIARFRQDFEGVAVQVFGDVLALCVKLGMTKVGVVAVDGTKVAANASLRANRTREQLEAEVREMFAEAEACDAAEDALLGDRRGDELPDELADRRRRASRLTEALDQLRGEQATREAGEEAARRAWQERQDTASANGEGAGGRRPRGVDPVQAARRTYERAQQRAAARRAGVEARAAAQGRKPTGPPPGEPNPVRRARERYEHACSNAASSTEPSPTPPAEANKPARANVSDPDSRIMKTAHGWVQGYNAQAAVSEDGIVVAAYVTQNAADVNECTPMMAATQTNLDAARVTEPVGTMLFDAGYCSQDNVDRDKTPGPDRLIATAKAWKLRRTEPTSGPPPDNAGPIQAMQHRLRTPEGAALYSKRQHTVEPVFGTIKEPLGFRRFQRRGLTSVDSEWKLICTVNNILKLFRRHPPIPAG
jgi:transposase